MMVKPMTMNNKNERVCREAYDACFFEFLYLTSIIRSLINKYIKYEKNKGTNYIDHRFPCADMIKHIIVGKECIAPIDIHGEVLYFVIQD